MALLETLMKPLLDAQREVGEEIGEARGEARGRAKATAEFEEWKAQQRSAGVQFVDDDDEPESAQPPADDQSDTMPGGRLTARVLEFLFKPLLKAQWQAGYEIGCAQAEAWNMARRQRIAIKKNCDDDVAAWVQYENWLSRQRSAPNNARSPK